MMHYIPDNFTNTGRIFFGLIIPRHAIEALAITIPLVYLIMFILPLPPVTALIIALCVGIPTLIIACVGIGGDSLTQRVRLVWTARKRMRKLHYEGEHVYAARKATEHGKR